jgi:hypothetical protein
MENIWNSICYLLCDSIFLMLWHERWEIVSSLIWTQCAPFWALLWGHILLTVWSLVWCTGKLWKCLLSLPMLIQHMRCAWIPHAKQWWGSCLVNLEAEQLDHHDISCQTFCLGNCGQCVGGVVLCWKMAIYMFLCFSSSMRNCLSRCSAQCSLGEKETPCTLYCITPLLTSGFPFQVLRWHGGLQCPIW